MQNGWVKLWRKSLKSGWLTNPVLWTFWSWCLLKATHKEIDIVMGFQQIHLNPGEFIFGRKAASKELKMSQQSIRTCVKNLSLSKNLTIKSTNKFSIISILNWDTYQGQDDDDNQQTNQQLTNDQPTANHKQECKEYKEDIYTSSNEDAAQQKLFKDIDNCPHQDIINAYHEILPEWPQVKLKLWNGQRAKLLRSRWRSNPKCQTLEWWKEFFKYIRLSDFLMGKTERGKGHENWQPNLEWVLRERNFVNIIEKKYHKGV